MKRLRFWIALMIFIPCLAALRAHAQEEGGIPDGTIITLRNWQQYRQYMPDGMQELFKGSYQWKIPPEFQMIVGPTHHYAPPKPYIEDTEKYAHNVGIKDDAEGRHILTGYVAGMPFPNPTEPMKGWKVLVNLWYAYNPAIYCDAQDWLYFMDRYHNRSSESFIEVYRKLDHISDTGFPITDPRSRGIQFAEYLEVLTPEQARYTAQVEFYYSDFAKEEDLFLFVPALRRSLRLSSAARCSPVIGSDYTQDEARNTLFNSTPARFDAKFLRNQNVLSMSRSNGMVYRNYDNFYPTILMPKPAVGKWELRPTLVIEVQRIPSQRKGYCYGKKVLWIDAEGYSTDWEDLYDEDMKLWKTAYTSQMARDMPPYGLQLNTGDQFSVMYDLQNSHLSFYNSGGRTNGECKNYDGLDFTDLTRYSSVAGLSQIMR